MTPYIVKAELISQDDISVFSYIRDVVVALPDLDFGKNEKSEGIVLSCHMLARAVGKVFSLRCIDGYFYPHYQHSWVITECGNIIDVYPVGILGGPILVVGNIVYAPGKFLYLRKPTHTISQGRFSKSSFRRSVRRIIEALGGASHTKSSFCC